MKEFYFNKFEHRKPYRPVKDNRYRTFLFKLSGLLTIAAGLAYLYWRWRYSLNESSLLFAIALVVAETFSFIGICFLVFELWQNKDAPMQAPPHYLSEISDLDGHADRPVRIDVFIATLNEDVELVRYTIRDAKAMEYPYGDVQIVIYVLDDGRRNGSDPAKQDMKQVCAEENVVYLTRETNEGYKAGNLKNGLLHSNGDLFLILDADSRPFPGFLKNTAGYFRKKTVAWVQTCHWFYDTTEAVPLSSYIAEKCNIRSPLLVKSLAFVFGRISTGDDIFGSDPRQFYEVIQRRRNYHNASFCCGAASLHRREAILSRAIGAAHEQAAKQLRAITKENSTDPREIAGLRALLLARTKVNPFAYHASEDLYTSMIMLSDPKTRWESVLHPYVEAKLLSPQDIGTFVKQRTRYAEGSVDIFRRDNPLFKAGLTWRQRLCYFHCVWSYFSCFWLIVFLLGPVIYFYTGAVPVNAEAGSFIRFFLPFFILNFFTELTGSWGVSQKRGKQYYICLFWINFCAVINVLSGKKIKFTVTPKLRQNAPAFQNSWPHITIIALTLSGIIINYISIAAGHQPNSTAFMVNSIWGLHNCYTLSVFVRAAYWNASREEAVSESRAGAGAETVLVKTSQ